MPLFRYVGEHECLHLGPPVRALRRGDVVPAPRNLDPAVFQLIVPQAAPPTREPVTRKQDALPPCGGIAREFSSTTSTVDWNTRLGEDGLKGETP